MVRHDVEQLPETGRGQPLAEPGVRGRATKLGVQQPVVDHIVAMRAARDGLQIGRAVQVTDTKRGQVAGDGGGVVEGEACVQLDPVGRGPLAWTWRLRGNHRGTPERGADMVVRVAAPGWRRSVRVVGLAQPPAVFMPRRLLPDTPGAPVEARGKVAVILVENAETERVLAGQLRLHG